MKKESDGIHTVYRYVWNMKTAKWIDCERIAMCFTGRAVQWSPTWAPVCLSGKRLCTTALVGVLSEWCWMLTGLGAPQKHTTTLKSLGSRQLRIVTITRVFISPLTRLSSDTHILWFVLAFIRNREHNKQIEASLYSICLETHVDQPTVCCNLPQFSCGNGAEQSWWITVLATSCLSKLDN